MPGWEDHSKLDLLGFIVFLMREYNPSLLAGEEGVNTTTCFNASSERVGVVHEDSVSLTHVPDATERFGAVWFL